MARSRPNSVDGGTEKREYFFGPVGGHNWRSGVAERARRLSKNSGLLRTNDSAPSECASSAISIVGIGPLRVWSFSATVC